MNNATRVRATEIFQVATVPTRCILNDHNLITFIINSFTHISIGLTCRRFGLRSHVATLASVATVRCRLAHSSLTLLKVRRYLSRCACHQAPHAYVAAARSGGCCQEYHPRSYPSRYRDHRTSIALLDLWCTMWNGVVGTQVGSRSSLRVCHRGQKQQQRYFAVMASGQGEGTGSRVVLWFRNDLRLHDNAIVHEAAQRVKTGKATEVRPLVVA